MTGLNPNDGTSELFLIEKRGLYYRPKSQGYTGLKREAGRYSFENAAIHAGPNGPDGSTDGIGIWREAEAPEFSTCCLGEVKLTEGARTKALNEAIRAIQKARGDVIHSGIVSYVEGISKGHDRSEVAIANLMEVTQSGKIRGGWDDGYDGQSAEAIDAHQTREEAAAEQAYYYPPRQSDQPHPATDDILGAIEFVHKAAIDRGMSDDQFADALRGAAARINSGMPT